MILLEGKPIADELKAELKSDIARLGYAPRLAIVMVGKNPASETFVALKEKFAREIGAETRRYEFDEQITTNELRARMKDVVHEPQNRGVIIQLPLPSQIDTQSILNTVVPEKDVDVLSARAVGDFQVGKSRVLPPVVGAIRALFQKHGIEVQGKHVVVIGYGRLVGQPIAVWAACEKAGVTIISDEKHFDLEIIRKADIIISGAGKPKMITDEMVKNGVVVVDVGTSEMAGEMVGDVDFESVSRVASFVTPQKGGVGPLTVAMVFKNLIALAKA